MKFFGRYELPPLRSRTLARLQDAFEGKTGVMRVFEVDDTD